MESNDYRVKDSRIPGACMKDSGERCHIKTLIGRWAL